MSNKGYKSQPLDFLVYEDAINYDLVADHEILGLTDAGELAQTSVIISFTQTQGSITTASTEGNYIVKNKDKTELNSGAVESLANYKLEINNITEAQLPITVEWSIGEQLVDSITITRDSKDGANGVDRIIERAYYWSSDYLVEPAKPTNVVPTAFVSTAEGEWSTSVPPSNIFEIKPTANIIFVAERSYLANLSPSEIANVPWNKPEVFLVRDESAYNILKTADGLFGYGQGVYYTYDPSELIKDNNINEETFIYKNEVNGWKKGEPIDASQTVIANWIVNGNGESDPLNSIENRKKVIKLYINAEYIQTGALSVKKDGETLFEAGLDNGTVKIGGFEVKGTNLYSTASHAITLADIKKIYKVYTDAGEIDRTYTEPVPSNPNTIDLPGTSGDYVVAIYAPNSPIPEDFININQELESILTNSYWMMSNTNYVDQVTQEQAVGQILVYDSTVEETLEESTSLYNKWISYEYSVIDQDWNLNPDVYYLTNVIAITPVSNGDGSVYIGTDRIQLGDKFIVDNLGNVTATGLRANKITVRDSTNNILLSANDEEAYTTNKVQIGGFEVDKDKLEAVSTETTTPILYINFDKGPTNIKISYYHGTNTSWTTPESEDNLTVEYWQYEYNEDGDDETAKGDTVVLYITGNISGTNIYGLFKYIDKVYYNETHYDHWKGTIPNPDGTTYSIWLLTNSIVESFSTAKPKVKLSTEELFLGTDAPGLNIKVPEYLYSGSKDDTLYFPAHTLFNMATYKGIKSIGYTEEGKLMVVLEYEYTEIIIPTTSEITWKDKYILDDKFTINNDLTLDIYTPSLDSSGSNSALTPRSVAQVTSNVNSDTTSGDTNNNDDNISEQKTTTIEIVYTLKSFSIEAEKIYWESDNGEVVSSSYYLYRNNTDTDEITSPKRAALYEVHYKESYFQVFNNGAMYANRASISGEISAQTGKIGGFTIEGNSLSSSAVNLSPQSLTLTGASLRIDDADQNNGISIETIGSTPVIEVLGKAKLQNKDGTCGFEWSNGVVNKTYTFRPILSATGTSGGGGNNTATINLQELKKDADTGEDLPADVASNWTTATNLLKARSFTIYTKGFDYGTKVRSQTITLNPGESTATISFGGYWTFDGVAWSSSATSFIKGAGESVTGSTFSQGINSGQTLYSLGSIMPKGTKQLQSITVYYKINIGSPVHKYDYIGTISACIDSDTTETTLDAWQTNSSQAPTWVYTRVSDNEAIANGTYLNKPTYYNYTETTTRNSVITFFNGNSSALNYQGQIVSRTVTGNTINLGDNDNKWTNIYGTTINGTTINGTSIYGTTLYGTLDNTGSDIRIKSDISKDISKYDNLFDSLQPASYKLTPLADNKTYLGFIAQDIEQSLIENNLTKADFGGLNITGSGYDNIKHEVIDYDKTSYHISYNDLHALEVRQIQLLKARVKELEEKLEKLTNK